MGKTIYVTLGTDGHKYLQNNGYLYHCNLIGDEEEIDCMMKKNVEKEDFLRELEFLRREGVVSVSDENMDEFVINFYSPGENYPKGLKTDEEWRDFIYEV